MTMDPLVLMTDVETATERLLRNAAALDGAAVAEPSRLPGWTRGHVLTHLARNADAYTNLLTWARTGVETPAYATATARAEGIETGAGRPVDDQIADLRAAAERFADAAAAMPAQAWTFVLPATGLPAAAVPWGRLREVEVHHVDLDAGYTPEDWTEAFAHRLLREIVGKVSAHPETPALVLRPDGVEHAVTLGDPAGATTVSGPVRSIAAWLAGRDDGSSLRVSPEGTLPTPAGWL
ncbi:MAG TPA: maleylpyruvate isomerase family mycothiol-dependent enzyme [Actinoplanes sp.]|jgi:maleylpyruvate isomerase